MADSRGSEPLLGNGEGIIQIEPNEEGSRCSSFRSARNNLFEKLPATFQSKYSALNLPPPKERSKGEDEYYEKQLATLKSFEEVDLLCGNIDIDEAKELKEEAQHEFLVNISNIANVFLLAFKIYATVKSGSIAIAASTLDSLLDLIAGAILWFTHKSMKNLNIYKYPIGKLRVQPVGIIIFAAIMATLGSAR